VAARPPPPRPARLDYRLPAPELLPLVPPVEPEPPIEDPPVLELPDVEPPVVDDEPVVPLPVLVPLPDGEADGVVVLLPVPLVRSLPPRAQAETATSIVSAMKPERIRCMVAPPGSLPCQGDAIRRSSVRPA
jgi:hypothetical protein